jgi:alkylation response protein AidB-like acyl-CoA dehydrogenase
MTPAGYSGTPLPKKLGVKEGSRVLLAGAPAGFMEELAPLPSGVVLHQRASHGPYDVIVGFCPDQATLLGRFDRWRESLEQAGGLWIGWPKKASGMTTDLTETVVREYGLSRGLVDNKVAALDQTWSGLRFVVRLTDRHP